MSPARPRAATDGLVHPLLGRTLVQLGYDRDFRRAGGSDGDPAAGGAAQRDPASGEVDTWRDDRARPRGGAIRVPPGTALDPRLDRQGVDRRPDRRPPSRPSWANRPSSAWAATCASPHPTAPGGGRSRCRRDPAGPGAAARVHDDGGLATSSTLVRRWGAGRGAVHHHLLDPRTGRPGDGGVADRGVAGASCVAANTAWTAAVVLGAAAPAWLADRGVAARLRPGRGTQVASPPAAGRTTGPGPRGGRHHRRPGLWYLNRGTGVVALVLLSDDHRASAWLALGGRPGPRRCPASSRRRSTETSRGSAVALVVVHIVTAVADEFVDIRWWHALAPFTGHLRAPLAGRRRRRLRPAGSSSPSRACCGTRMSHRTWRAVHQFGLPPLWLSSILHGMGMGSDMRAGAVGGDRRVRRCGADRHRLAGSPHSPSTRAARPDLQTRPTTP